MSFDEVRAVAETERKRIAQEVRGREEQQRKAIMAESHHEATIETSTRAVEDLTKPFLRAAGRKGSEIRQSVTIRRRSHRGWVIRAGDAGYGGEYGGDASPGLDGIFMDTRGRFWAVQISITERCVAPRREDLIRRLGDIAARHGIRL